MFEEQRRENHRMPEGHEARFEARLDRAFPTRKRTSFFWIGIAASVVALLGFAIWSLRPDPVVPQEQPVVSADSTASSQGLSLGDLSPDLRKLEQYYTANINLELASLDISGENKVVADDYIARLRELDAEYRDLNRELNEIGPNEETITAMIRNFQIRLELLMKLKAKLNELKQSNNETVSSNSV